MNIQLNLPPATLDAAVARAADALLSKRDADGHFLFHLEADAAIPAEYILLKHMLGEPDPEMERLTGAYLRRIQEPHGGWPKLAGGALDMSASVKAYFALKVIGDSVDAPHMQAARAAIRAAGGAVRMNMFTRTVLALFGIVPWRAIPAMPVELLHAPLWFPVNLYRISYWARCTLVPLLVLMALKPRAPLPKGVSIDELFLVPADRVRRWPKPVTQTGPWGAFFGIADAIMRIAEPFVPRRVRSAAIDKAVAFLRERLNGEHGVGAIYPSIVYTVLMFRALGVPDTHPDMAAARAAMDKLFARDGAEGFCQPCVSPVWDTALATQALFDAMPDEPDRMDTSLAWLRAHQVLDVKGDWAVRRPDLRPGGWAFQFSNPHYVDLDDTAVVVMLMDKARRLTGTRQHDEAITRGRDWIVGMQSTNGGFAAYDVDNTSTFLNHIPYADHGALLDPPTADVTARCIAMLGQLGERPDTSVTLRRAVAFLLAEQHSEGSWFGRWGINYIYGTWSVLSAFSAIGFGRQHAALRKAVAWLVSIQNSDGGWGEDDAGYALDYTAYRPAPSTASQTAWALLGLMAVGESDTPAVRHGIDYLQATQGPDGLWDEPQYTAVGFPRVFYLRYGGYPKFFPLMAIARYRNLRDGRAADGLGM